ncbi:putative quinol monooxygenase [Chitinophaga nivalis]|uniref:Antibiotic biosynthesis monooxygenase n=1 Tax=Chitinophaga nivalis TaxID=2991709 RepID=A0ABT3IH16_9BACT|nr:putative quinol monooxygenase [Chitinophaga nivalis]MCW3467046.1 antibiotic biosynthesis monooxygenase [Chitinophaga nivalis]MCW3483263.1 antibiotic biosynthesis monooxygenase [Chitinophaga nivalis]
MYKLIVALLVCLTSVGSIAAKSVIVPSSFFCKIPVATGPEMMQINAEKKIDTIAGKIVSIYGFLRPKKEQAAALREALLLLVNPTREEPGNLVYNIHEEKDGSFFLYEVWRSQEDLDLHFQKPYLQAFMGKINDWLAGNIEAHSGKLIAPWPQIK